MIDLHAHVLPGFDDGAADWQTALAMCRRAATDGIGCLVATPHFHRGIFPTPDLDPVRAAGEKLQALCHKGLVHGLEIMLGADCHLHAEIVKNLEDGKIPALNDSRYVLLEFPEHNVPLRTDELIFEMRLAGFTPIIPHPERNAVMSKNPGVLYDLLQTGAYAQVTTASLTGLFGSSVQRTAEEMVGQIHFA